MGVSEAQGFGPLFPAAKHVALSMCRSLGGGCRSGPRSLGMVGGLVSILRSCVFSIESLVTFSSSGRVFRGGGRTTLGIVSVTLSVGSGCTLRVSCLTVVTRGDIVTKS